MSSQVRFWSPRWLQEGFFGPLEGIFWPSWGHVWAILCDLGAIKMSISSRRNAHFWKQRFHLRYKRLIIRHKQQCRYHYHVKMRIAKKHRKTPGFEPIFGIFAWKSSSYTPSLEAFLLLLKVIWSIMHAKRSDVGDYLGSLSVETGGNKKSILQSCV